MDFKDEGRFGVRLLIRTPPPSLALTRISQNNFIAGFDTLGPAKAVRQLCAFGARVGKPTHYPNTNIPVIFKQRLNIGADGLEFVDSERLQLLVERCSQRPTTVDIPRGIAVRSWSIVNDEFDHMGVHLFHSENIA